MFYLGILVLVIIAAAWTVPAVANIRSRREIDSLKQRYRQLTFASAKVADEALRLQIIRLKSLAPGRSERWYLERVIRELESGRMHHLHEIKK